MDSADSRGLDGLPGGLARLLSALVLSGLLWLPDELDKHHYVARSVFGRVYSGLFIWLASALLIWLALAAVTWLVGRLPPHGRRGILAGAPGWMIGSSVGAILIVLLELSRHHYAYPQWGPRVSAAIFLWYVASLAIRVILLFIGAARGRVSDAPRAGT